MRGSITEINYIMYCANRTFDSVLIAQPEHLVLRFRVSYYIFSSLPFCTKILFFHPFEILRFLEFQRSPLVVKFTSKAFNSMSFTNKTEKSVAGTAEHGEKQVHGTTLRKSLSKRHSKRLSFFGGGGAGRATPDVQTHQTNGTSNSNKPQDWPNVIGFDYHKDVTTPVKLDVRGEIPEYVRGVLYRIGPGGHTLEADNGETFSVDHWFDGFSQIHRFNIVDSKTIYYNSRHTCDSLLVEYRRQGCIGNKFSFGQGRDPCKSVFSKFMSVFKGHESLNQDPVKNKDKVNIGVSVSANMPGLPSTRTAVAPQVQQLDDLASAANITSLYAKTDSCTFQALDPNTLEPVGIARQTVLHPDLKGQLSSAHARTCPVTGDLFNYNLELGAKPMYRVFTVSKATGKTRILATIDDAPAAYIHSFWLTERFIVLGVWNSTFKYNGLGMMWHRNIIDSLEDWEEGGKGKKARFYVVDRRVGGHGVVGVYDTEAFFAFHTVNAWEEDSSSGNQNPAAEVKVRNQKDSKGGKRKKTGETPGEAGKGEDLDLVLEVCALENLDLIKKFYYSNLLGDPKPMTSKPRMRRYRLENIYLPPTFVTVSPLNSVVTTITAATTATQTSIINRSSTTTALPSSSKSSKKPKPGYSLHGLKIRPAKIEFIVPSHLSFELPTMNPEYVTRPHRYTYGMHTSGKSTLLEMIMKYDSKTGKVWQWETEGHTPGEVIFIPRPSGNSKQQQEEKGQEKNKNSEAEKDAREDDGVLLSVVLDGYKGKSYLLCLDAKELTELGRAEMESVVAFGFHGRYVGAPVGGWEEGTGANGREWAEW